DGIIALDTEGKISEMQYEALKVKLLENPKIKQVVGGPLPGRTMTTAIQNRQGESFDIHIAYILDDYPALLDIEMIDGHSFDFNQAINDTDVIVNEEAYKLLGLSNQDNTFFYNELSLQTFMTTRKEMKAIGVMKDYHFANFKNEIGPLFIQISKSKGLKEQIGIKFNNTSATEILALIAATWHELNIEQPLSYHFLSDSYSNFHSEENSIASGFKYISYLAIALSALGLFGLSSLDVKRSFKNISIKKVVGASSRLISREYLKSYLSLALLCSVIGISIAFWLIQNWLEAYVYRFEIDIMTITLPVLLMLFMAVASIFYNVFTAASVNPVENLKKE
ncbi:MAG: ABC transporter permease, partial [Fulvivirga sp.]